jgi:predicted 2-oxoglutarate/Fe(II)-dependent dioxygenase YbiX
MNSPLRKEQKVAPMGETIVSAVQSGDRAPACYGMTDKREFYSFEEQYGRPVVLILADAAAGPDLPAVIGEFTARLHLFAVRDADVLLVVNDNPSGLWPGGHALIRTIDCGRFLDRCGVGARESLFRPDERADAVAACLGCLDELPHEAPRDVSQPAPAVVLPNLLSRKVCQSLIKQFESGPTIDGEVARIDAAGIARSVVDHKKKNRRDMQLSLYDGQHLHLQHLLLGRCAPEIAKAFQVTVSHTDRILVSCYDEAAGWFRRHRDNTADNVAFRQFALSVNLNTEEYAGGHLLFPEYNDHRYSPPTGGGVLFSTAVLHEAAPVTSGRRYVLLTFFHSDAAEARRQAAIALV